MPFTLHTSNRLEVLVERLSETLRQPLQRPLEPEIVVVQSQGMERWLSMQVARHNGICANLRFPFPNALVQEITAMVLPETGVHAGGAPLPADPFAPQMLSWKIMAVLPACLPRPAFKQLATYLTEPGANLKRLQLSSRVADLFDQYQLFRPEMIQHWSQGDDESWQAQLWWEVRKEQKHPDRAAARQALLSALEQLGAAPGLPGRISVFGISTLPAFYLKLLDAISRFSQINLFLLNPCREYWGDIVAGRGVRRTRPPKPEASATVELFAADKGNSLLASMGLLGRDFFEMVEQFDYEQQQQFDDPGAGGLLQAVQSDLLNLRDRSLEGNPGLHVPSEQPSIRFQTCHSVRREVEVLQDHLLDLFTRMPGLNPGDVLVMAPDIEPYAPFVHAVFDLAYDDRRRIPYSIADRTFQRESDVISAFSAMLEMPGSRFEATQVLTLLENKPVQQKLGLDAGDMDWIYAWVRDVRIRWGKDAADRERLGLPGVAQNSWRAGLDRLLLGYALPGNDEHAFEGVVPFDRVEGQHVETLGKLAEFIDRLFATAEILSRRMTLSQWRDVLSNVLDEFFAVTDTTAADFYAIRRVLTGLDEAQTTSQFDEKVELAVVRHHIQQRLAHDGHGFGFLTGGVTFCSMLPMRSIPARVLCLLGMNNDAYPRQTRPLGFDLIAKQPRKGDRSRRNDDRYLFLEAILSARDELFISYVGQCIKDSTEVPPSVLVSELRDYLDANFVMDGAPLLEQITCRHHLQAFNSKYFQGDDKLFSYSHENLEAARGLLSAERRTSQPFISRPLPEPEESFDTVTLADLYRFFRNPAQFLLNRRLGLYLPKDPDVVEDTESFELAGLEQYGVAQALIRRYETAVEPETRQEHRAARLLSGELPHAAVGEIEFDALDDRAREFMARTNPLLQGGALAPLAFDRQVSGGRVTGPVTRLFSAGMVFHRYARIKAKDFLQAWIYHLALHLLQPEVCPATTFLAGVDHAGVGKWRGWTFGDVDDPESQLASLVKLYRQGLRQPLCFFPETAHAYTSALRDRNATAKSALTKAEKAWRGGSDDTDEHGHYEVQDPYLELCFRGQDAPLGTEFQEMARLVFDPILDLRRPLH